MVLRKTISYFLDLVFYFLRNLPHSRHGHNPFRVGFYETHSIYSSHFESSYCIHPDNIPVNTHAFTESLHHNIAITIHFLKSKMNDANSNKRRKLWFFEVGELVMFVVSWEGPYKIVMKLNDVIIKLFLVRKKITSQEGYLFKPF